MTHVSQAYNAPLNTHVSKTASLVFSAISLLFQIWSNAARAALALANLKITSLLQLRSCVNVLPRYTNSLTFSRTSPSSVICRSIVSLPNTIVFVFALLTTNPYGLLSDASLIVVLSSSSMFSSIMSMSSANLRLFIFRPCTDIPLQLSLTPSIALSKSEINTSGDIGSPCLVPLSVLNHSPNSFCIQTAAIAFSFMSLRIVISLSLTPYELRAAQVTS